MHSLLRPLLLLLLVSFGVTQIAAQPRERPPAKVVLFSQPGFRGERIELEAGDKVDDFKHLRFPSGRTAHTRVASVRIEGDAEVSFFSRRLFLGEHISSRRSIDDLSQLPDLNGEGWNRALYSLIVREPERRRPPHHGGRRDETDRIVRRAYQDVLGRDPDRAGLDTYVGILQDRGWTEDRLREELRKSREYRQEVIPREVRAAYLEVLGREPDSAGQSYYVGRMLNKGWTAGRVREALRNSPEYRNRPGA